MNMTPASGELLYILLPVLPDSLKQKQSNAASFTGEARF